MINQGYLLLIEDEPQVQAYYKKVLERRGYIIRQAFTLAEARTMIGSDMPRAIVLDIGLPDGSGLDFLHELRKTSNVPVLMLTAMGTPKDVVKGLETGGDIYLAKPCELSTFISYVDALLRRSAIIPESLTIGRLKIELVTNKAFLDGEDMYLAAKEVSLLMVFAQHLFPDS